MGVAYKLYHHNSLAADSDEISSGDEFLLILPHFEGAIQEERYRERTALTELFATWLLRIDLHKYFERKSPLHSRKKKSQVECTHTIEVSDMNWIPVDLVYPPLFPKAINTINKSLPSFSHNYLTINLCLIICIAFTQCNNKILIHCTVSIPIKFSRTSKYSQVGVKCQPVGYSYEFYLSQSFKVNIYFTVNSYSHCNLCLPNNETPQRNTFLVCT